MSKVSADIPNTFFGSFFNMTDAEMSKCSMYNLKLTLFIILIIILIFCLMSSLTSIFSPPPFEEMKENFSNDLLFSYKDAINANYSNYQSASLTAPNTPEGNPSNLLFGRANRTVIYDSKLKSVVLYLNVSCNLYVMGGNPFGETNVIQDNKKYPQNYLVYIKNAQGKTELLDELKKDNDGIYKLKYFTKDQEKIKKLLSFNEIDIVYNTPDGNNLILGGKFTLA